MNLGLVSPFDQTSNSFAGLHDPRIDMLLQDVQLRREFIDIGLNTTDKREIDAAERRLGFLPDQSPTDDGGYIRTILGFNSRQLRLKVPPSSGEGSEVYAPTAFSAVIFRSVAELTKELPHKASVVDFGCGVGTYGAIVLDTRSDVSYTGIDINARSIWQAQDNLASYANANDRVRLITDDMRNVQTEPADLVIANLPIWPLKDQPDMAQKFHLDDGQSLHEHLFDRAGCLVAAGGTLVCTFSTIQDTSSLLGTLATQNFRLKFDRVVKSSGFRIGRMSPEPATKLAEVLTRRTRVGKAAVEVVWKNRRPVATRTNIAALVARIG